MKARIMTVVMVVVLSMALAAPMASAGPVLGEKIKKKKIRKVIIHNGKKLLLPLSAVEAHLNHGD